jgi:nucleotidyltransferase/DNA polymerase involved in DNA repair
MGVGQKTLPVMRGHGIATIGDLAALNPARVKQLLGLGALKMYELAGTRRPPGGASTRTRSRSATRSRSRATSRATAC